MITKTGIVATLGPATEDQDRIRQLIEAGVTTFRLNFSHGDRQTHGALLENIRQAAKKFPHAVAVMGDLCGPKIRTGRIEPDGGIITEGSQVILTAQEIVGTPQRFSISYPNLIEDVQIGQRILLDDGSLVLQAESKEKGILRCKALVGGPLYSRKGVNLPDTDLSIPAITPYDWQWADWAVENDLDYLALSFVQQAEEVVRLKQSLVEKGSSIKVVSKIEKPRAVENLESIIHASDAVLVARGDLGVEMAAAEVPLIQKRITRLCRRFGKPVIVATQVLQSMIEHPWPTRAEVSDIANAVMDFADAVMLSGETAVGKYPLEAVRVISQVCGKTEAYMDTSNLPRPPIETDPGLHDLSVIARSVAQMVDEIECALVAVGTKTGATARLLSKARIDVPILSFCPNPRMNRQISMHYGVLSILCPLMQDLHEFTAYIESCILQNGWARKGQRIVILPGRDLMPGRDSQAVILHTLPESDLQV
ncbi:MAG TPA: pyruvate kinase [Anaerohalosphaeraceae bacterium]|nr:pyruvate kinase [Anaerohalosphaeraceae bacterium]